MSRRFILTGAPGTGKTSLLAELARRGMNTVTESARAILTDQRQINGSGTGDRDPALFVRLMLARMMADWHAADSSPQPVIFDRGIPDLFTYARVWSLNIPELDAAVRQFRYDETVLFCPIWLGIFVNDDERTLSFDDARAFEADLRVVYSSLGFVLIDVPLDSVEARADFVARFLRDTQNVA